LVLSAWGARLAWLMWDDGPWGYSAWLESDTFWLVQYGALATWAACRAACWAWAWRRPALAHA
jgi:hypothetical protein